jgi:predicted AlkP superfamily pyrophosphatase or phosphodiesterase
MYISFLLVGAAALALSGVECNPVPKAKYKYVAVFSVDGFHPSDVEKYVAARPQSTIARLLETAYEYTNAKTSAPSDSFPGTLAQFTGASPRTTGVWYDDAYDRTFFLPSSGCVGPPGAEG